MRDDAKRLLRDGRDPVYEVYERQKTKPADIARHEHSFEPYGREWHAAQKDCWTQVHSNDVASSLERSIFLTIGSLAITVIDEALVLAVLKPVVFWLSDESWARIDPHLTHGKPGKPRVDDRRVLSGMLHVFEVGCRWRDVPTEYGPATTV